MLDIALIVPSVLLFFMVYYAISKQKFTVTETVIGILLTYCVVLAVITVSNYIPVALLNADIFGNLALTGCLFLFAMRKVKKALQSGHYVFFSVVVAMIGNTIVGVLLDLAFRATTEVVRENMLWYAPMVVLTFLLCFVIATYIGDSLYKSYRLLSLEIKEKFAAHGFILSVCAYILAQLNIFVYRLIDERLFLSAINVMLIVAMFSVAFVTMTVYSRSQQVLLEMEFKEKSLKDLTDHYHHLGSAYEEIRQYKHDHHQLLHSIMGFADDKAHDGLKNFLTEKLEYSKEVLDKLDESMDKLEYVHILELKGLLSVKFAQALSRGVKLNLDFTEPIDNIPINRMDLSRMVGIIVDNAIEELETCTFETKHLNFGILLEGSDVLIVCTNSCGNPPDVGQIFKKNFTTKEPGRGLGLYNLKEICKESGNALCTAYSEDDEFTVILTIGQV